MFSNQKDDLLENTFSILQRSEERVRYQRGGVTNTNRLLTTEMIQASSDILEFPKEYSFDAARPPKKPIARMKYFLSECWGTVQSYESLLRQSLKQLRAMAKYGWNRQSTM